MLRAKLAKTKARLWRLAAFDAFFIPSAILLVSLILIASGAATRLSEQLSVLFFCVIVLAFGLMLLRGFARFRAPTDEDARRALDDSDPVRPISSISDYPAQINASASRYWKHHKAYLKTRILALEVPGFFADWRTRDPLFLRFVLPILAIGFITINADQFTERFRDASSPDFGSVFGADKIEVSGWITPPDYTGRAPVFLSADTQSVEVPAGSQLTLRVLGPNGARLRREASASERLTGPRALSFSQREDGAQELELSLNVSQDISVDHWGERAFWEIEIIEDLPPRVEFTSLPEPGEKEGFQFGWSASDDFGVVEARLLLATRDGASVAAGKTDWVEIDLPDVSSVSLDDITKLNLERHKWVGEAIDLSIVVKDAKGQTASSERVPFVLPGRLFLEPMAKVNQEIRLELLREDEQYVELTSDPQHSASVSTFRALGDRLGQAPSRVQRAALMLDGATYRPELFVRDQAVYLSMRRAYETIRIATGMSDLAQLDQLLWFAALRAEFGTLADAARRLEAARRALERALREGASEDEIRRLMQAFRDAAEDYIAARMAEALMNPNAGPQPEAPAGSSMQGQDLEDMLSALEDLTETGATDAARQLLDDVANLLNNLQFQSGGSGGDGEPFGEGQEGDPDEDKSDQEQALERALDTLSDLMEEQRRLNDDTFQERQGLGDAQNAPGQSGDGLDGQSEQGDTDSGSLADRQRSILNELGEFSESIGEGEDTGDGSGLSADEFEEALRALGQASNALERDDLDRAQWNQDRAIRALREAAGELSEQLDAEAAARRGELGENEAADDDPTGRPSGGMQMNTESGIELPDGLDRQRAKDILDELRERLDNSSDEEEREYLNRLLDRFGE